MVILGPTGKNFAAGMSGGYAYVYDENNTFDRNCNPALVTLERELSTGDQEHLKGLLLRYIRETGSQKARKLINDWQSTVNQFVKVVPKEYQAMLTKQMNRGA